MGKSVKFEYDDVKNFSKEFRKKTSKRSVDAMCRNICDIAMENTISEAENKTIVYSGELKDAWRRNIGKTKKTNGVYSKTAINKAYNQNAKNAGYTPYYALFIELGHKKVGWRKDTHGIHMLRDAEENTLNKLQEIVDGEINELLGGIFK